MTWFWQFSLAWQADMSLGNLPIRKLSVRNQQRIGISSRTAISTEIQRPCQMPRQGLWLSTFRTVFACPTLDDTVGFTVAVVLR